MKQIMFSTPSLIIMLIEIAYILLFLEPFLEMCTTEEIYIFS